MKKRIHWVYQGDAGCPGLWVSSEGRFVIEPRFNHSTRPQGYEITDYLGEWTSRVDERGHALRAFTKSSGYSVQICKRWAEERVAKTVI